MQKLLNLIRNAAVKVRLFIIRMFVLDYFVKVSAGNKSQMFNFTRSATILFPLTVVTGLLFMFGYETWAYTTFVLFIICAIISFAYLQMWPAKFDELKSVTQRYQYVLFNDLQKSTKYDDIISDDIKNEVVDDFEQHVENAVHYNLGLLIFHPLAVFIITCIIVTFELIF